MGRWAAKYICAYLHEAADKADAAMEAHAEGMRALRISLGGLGATAVIQAVTAPSGTVALLGDTLP